MHAIPCVCVSVCLGDPLTYHASQKRELVYVFRPNDSMATAQRQRHAHSSAHCKEHNKII
jgi:hypothetical protein